MVSTLYEYQKDYIKKYQAKNKEEIDRKRSVKMECEICKRSFQKNHLSAHKKSKLHLKILQIYNELEKNNKEIVN